MSKVSQLLQVSNDEKNAIFKMNGVTEDEFDQLVDTLKEWLMKSNLPIEGNNDNKIRMVLFNSKMSLEKSKQCITGYYRIRTVHSDFFDRLMPYTQDYEKCKSLTKSVVMPRLTPDLCRVHIFKMTHAHGETIDGLLYQIVALMEAELRIMTGDFFLSNIIIIDLESFGLKQLMRYTPSVIQTLVNIMVAINLRLKNIHFVNTSAIIDRVMILTKTFLPGKFLSKVCSHKTHESLQEYIPKEYLPADYDGDQPSIAELHDEWCSFLESREEDFKSLLNAKCEDIMDTQANPSEIFGLGPEGSFKKLAID